MQVWARLDEALNRFGRAAMVTVISTTGSAPREAGSRMVINPDGTFTGTIGGGALEWRTIALAQSALSEPSVGRAEIRSFALGPELGQCCGGRVEILVELIGDAERAMVGDLAALEAAGRFMTRAQVSPETGVAREAVTGMNIPTGTAIWRDGLLIESFGDDQRPLCLFGAGHVGRALVLATAQLPFVISWIDPRPDAFPSHLPRNVTAHQIDDPTQAIAAAPAGSFILVMTHSHALDQALVGAALAANRFPYVGLIGSASKRARFARRLAEAGIAPEQLGRLVCPIGIDGIRSKAPAHIAAATVAELLICDEALRKAGSDADDSDVQSHRVCSG